MTPEAASRFPRIEVALRGGRRAALRPLTEDDGEALAAFYAAIPREDAFFYYPHALDREHALRNAARARDPREVVVVLEAPDHTIAGYGWVRWPESRGLPVFGICARRDYQDSGAGRAMMQRVFEIVDAVGPGRVGLTVQKRNPRAVALYTSIGFRVVREQLRATDSEPEYAMERVRPG